MTIKQVERNNEKINTYGVDDVPVAVDQKIVVRVQRIAVDNDVGGQEEEDE